MDEIHSPPDLTTSCRNTHAHARTHKLDYNKAQAVCCTVLDAVCAGLKRVTEPVVSHTSAPMAYEPLTLLLSAMVMCPILSMDATSPVENQPSEST